MKNSDLVTPVSLKTNTSKKNIYNPSEQGPKSGNVSLQVIIGNIALKQHTCCQKNKNVKLKNWAAFPLGRLKKEHVTNIAQEAIPKTGKNLGKLGKNLGYDGFF